MQTVTSKEVRFGFGKNWQLFLRTLDEERIELAIRALMDFLPMDSLEGKTFLDIGSGSGLHSYAAHLKGAKEILSIDLDQYSIECTKYLHETAGSPANWKVQEASALDSAFLAALPKYDVVYSWGVLHHTGRMYDAIANAAELVKDGGYLYLALYNRTQFPISSPLWEKIKRWYNTTHPLGRWALEGVYMAAYVMAIVLMGKNPVRHIRDYEKVKRGMSWRRDVVDWLGGYPYEYATVDEIFHFMKERFPAFTLENVKSTCGLANNWFLFQKRL